MCKSPARRGFLFAVRSAVPSGKPSIAIYCAEPARRQDATALAARLALPLIRTPDAPYDLLLSFAGGRLELRQTGASAPGPVYVDFAAGPCGYRLAKGGHSREILTRAIGLRGSLRPELLDATAGLGCDGLMLALLGCRVTMVERSPVIHALLADGLDRARAISRLTGALQRVSLHLWDSIHYLEVLPRPRWPDVIYLDPMYPHQPGSALNRKEMRVLRRIAGDDGDAADLLAVALGRARRVVVKRPRLAPPLAGRSPTVRIKGRSTRYDVYALPL
jgi:16S rRNA (guanine1516-N2)-methyltransferase